MAEIFAPLPVRDEVAIKDPDTEKLLLSKPYIDWLTKMTLRVDETPQRVQTISLTDQDAAIGTTSLPITGQGAGLYRVTYYLHITQAASVSSSLQITITWIDNGDTCSVTGAAITSNTTQSTQGDSLTVRADQPPVITFSTAYSSVGSPAMQYSVDIVAEAIG